MPLYICYNKRLTDVWIVVPRFDMEPKRQVLERSNVCYATNVMH